MPNLATHIHFAHQASIAMENSTIEEHMGSFLLGSTSPDIRVITKRKREEYHFSRLDFDHVGDSVTQMFKSHPELRVASDHDGPTKAFIAGYITHLTADENWIANMYRPYFGNLDKFPNETEGHVMDRALQLELDQQCWSTIDQTLETLSRSTEEIRLRFIQPDALLEWRKWVTNHLGKGFSWERLRFMAKRIAAGKEEHLAHTLANNVLNDVLGSMDNLRQTVPEQRISLFKKHTLGSVVKAVDSYLE